MAGRIDSLRGGDCAEEEERDRLEEGGEPENHWSISPEAIWMICLIKLGRALTIPRQTALRETFRAACCVRYHIRIFPFSQPEFQHIPACIHIQPPERHTRLSNFGGPIIRPSTCGSAVLEQKWGSGLACTTWERTWIPRWQVARVPIPDLKTLPLLPLRQGVLSHAGWRRPW